MSVQRRSFFGQALATGLLLRAGAAAAQEPLRNNAQEDPDISCGT